MKTIKEIVYILLDKSSKSSVHCTLITHLNLNAVFSSKIIDLKWDFIKLIVEDVCCSPWGCKESDTTELLNNNK